jgi:hypothetical protein
MFITSALMLLASHASATEFEGRMDCKVKTMRVTQIKEGIGEEFSGFRDSLKAGDSVSLNYEFLEDKVIFQLRDSSRGNDYWDLYIKKYSDGVDYYATDNALGVGIQEGDSQHFFSQDNIHSKGFHFTNMKTSFNVVDGKIALKRYYKNDWQGLYFSHSGLQIIVFTLDCRHTKDKLDQMIQNLRILEAAQE